MVELKDPDPVKLFVAALLSDISVVPVLRERLVASFGDIDYESEAFEFDVTDYYEQEMGPALKRQFFSFARLIPPGEIVEAKLTTNDLESEFLHEGKRKVNLDPGYLDYYKIVLASGKFQGQKVHVGKGVYADLTLYYDKTWKPYPWGFPDFRSGRYNAALSKMRELYKAARRSLTSHSEE